MTHTSKAQRKQNPGFQLLQHSIQSILRASFTLHLTLSYTRLSGAEGSLQPNTKSSQPELKPVAPETHDLNLEQQRACFIAIFSPSSPEEQQQSTPRPQLPMCHTRDRYRYIRITTSKCTQVLKSAWETLYKAWVYLSLKAGRRNQGMVRTFPQSSGSSSRSSVPSAMEGNASSPPK